MAKLIYSPIASLDGYVADEDGKWGWSVPDNAVHALVSDLARPLGTWLLGRRMYDVLVAWEVIDDAQPEIRDFADIWLAADKVVYSRTLGEPSSARTRIEREFVPEAVSRMKDEAERDLSVGGAKLAAPALRRSGAPSRPRRRDPAVPCRRSWLAVARRRCRVTSVSRSNCSTSAGLATASSTCGIASAT